MPASIPLHFHGIDHVVLKIASIERAVHFYVDVLGLKLERIIDDFGIYQLRCGRHLIDLQVLPAGGELAAKDARAMDHLCLLIAGDFATIVPYLEQHAVAIVSGPVEVYGASGFGTSIYVQDPDGHTLELKLDHAEFPVRTNASAVLATSTWARPEPRQT